MIIHQPETRNENGEVIVSTRVEFDTANFPAPETLTFALPERYAPMLTDRPEPSVTSLLVLPMVLREPVQVRGTLSPRLHYGLQMTMEAFNFFLPRELHIVEISADHLTEANPDAMVMQGVSALFSGGVDSLHTIWKHLPERQPIEAFRITHAFFVHGYDISLRHTTRYTDYYASYRDLLAKYDIELIPVRTNVRDFTNLTYPYVSLKGTFGYSSSFPAIAQLFGRGIRTHYIAAGLDFSQARPLGTHYAIDYHPGTETLAVYHDGADRSRTEKIADIATWQDALDVLRVCISHPEAGQVNCCRCYKCTRTMVRLALVDALDRAPTFPLPLTKRQIYRRAWRKPHVDPPFFDDVLPSAKRRRPDLYLPLRVASLLGRAEMIRQPHPVGYFKRERPLS